VAQQADIIFDAARQFRANLFASPIDRIKHGRIGAPEKLSV